MTRRARGEGSIGPYKGKWRVRITVRGKRKAWILPTKQEAARKLRSVLKELEQGRTIDEMHVRDKGMTVEVFLRDWINMRALQNMRTAVNYERVTNRFIWAHGSMRLTQITPALITEYLAALRPSAAYYEWAILKAAFKHAKVTGRIYSNPVDAVRPPRQGTSIGLSLSQEEIGRLLTECETDAKVGAMVTTALIIGARHGELCALTWNDVDFGAQTISIDKTLVRVNPLGPAPSYFELHPPKTFNGRRVLTVGPHLLDVLREHRIAQQTARLARRKPWPHPELVFAGPTGDYLSSVYVWHAFKMLISRARVREIRFHDLRHTAATTMLLRGVPVHAVSKFLGHANIQITLNRYAHVIDSMGHNAAHAMDALLDLKGSTDGPEGVENPIRNHHSGGTSRDGRIHQATSRELGRSVTEEGLSSF
jgi:integrase